jgi:hypothetical protein
MENLCFLILMPNRGILGILLFQRAVRMAIALLTKQFLLLEGYLLPFMYQWSDINIPFFRCYEDQDLNYQTTDSCQKIITNVKEQVDKNAIFVTPNPSSDTFKIFFNDDHSELYLELRNHIGSLVHSTTIYKDSERSYTLPTLPNGVYSLFIYDKSTTQVFFKKLIKI